MEINFNVGVQTRGTHPCKLIVMWVQIYPHENNFDPQTKLSFSQDNNDSKCKAIQSCLQAKSLKVYAGLPKGREKRVRKKDSTDK